MRTRKLLSLLLCFVMLPALFAALGGEAKAEGENILLSVVCDPPEGGVVAIGDRAPAHEDTASFPRSTNVTLTATPAEGYRLAYWTNKTYPTMIHGNANSLELTVTSGSDVTYIAHFIPTDTVASAMFTDGAGNRITELDLGVETVGYMAYPESRPSDVRIGQRLLLTNTGDCELAPSRVSFLLDEESRAYFRAVRIVLGEDGTVNKNGGQLSTWYVCPENGLEPGVYEGTVRFVERCQPGLSEPVTLKVRFEVTEDAIIRTKASPESGGSVTGAGRYAQGETITLTAEPDAHYSFKEWICSAGRPTENPLVLEAETSLAGTYTAVFTVSESHVIAEVAQGNGRVEIDGYEPVDGKYDFWIPVNETVTVRAVPDEGWRLAYWINPANGFPLGAVGSCEYKMSGAIGAVFLPTTANCSVRLADGAEVIDLGKASEGYTAYSIHSYSTSVYIGRQIRVQNTGDCVIAQADACFALSGENADCFRVMRTYLNYDRQINPGAYMSYSWTVCPENGLSEGVYEATVTFVERCQGGIDPPASIKVRFEVTKSYQITAKVEEDKGGMVTGAGYCPAGDPITLTATADVNYAFDHWTRGDGTVVTDNPLTFVPTEVETVTASFRRTGYTVSVSADPAAGGSIVNGSGDPAVSRDGYAPGTPVTLTAVAREGYLFGYWTDNGSVLAPDPGTQATVTVTANPDHALVAHFVQPTVDARRTAGGVKAVVTAPAGSLVIAVSIDAETGRVRDVKTAPIVSACVERNLEIPLALSAGCRWKLFLVNGAESFLPLCTACVEG